MSFNKNKIPSGKFVLRLPSDLHKTIKDRAFQEGVSLNDICLQFIEAGLLSFSPVSRLHQQVQENAKRLYGDRFIGLLLFGSQARGEAHDKSDIDLLLVLDNSIPVCRELYKDWTGIMPENVSIHFAHLPQDVSLAGSLWLECALDARIIDDPRNEIARHLTKLRQFITSGKVIRKLTHGQGYWVHT